MLPKQSQKFHRNLRGALETLFALYASISKRGESVWPSARQRRSCRPGQCQHGLTQRDEGQ
jgi:hypothetical protein